VSVATRPQPSGARLREPEAERARQPRIVLQHVRRDRLIEALRTQERVAQHHVRDCRAVADRDGAPRGLLGAGEVPHVHPRQGEVDLRLDAAGRDLLGAPEMVERRRKLPPPERLAAEMVVP
jgi:hypothetical protein